MNNPPLGMEGDLYAEIARTKPAPQGICSTNSYGKVLAWALSFDNDESILKFLDHVVRRYHDSRVATGSVTAQRFMKFPSRELPPVEDNGKRLDVPHGHAHGEVCPAKPQLERGTLVGRIIGRALDEDGQPVADTLRQEHYMEARFEIPTYIQDRLAATVKKAGKKEFKLPPEFGQALVSHAYLGQLDVNPLRGSGSLNQRRHWGFLGKVIESDDADTVRIQVTGHSDVEGGPNQRGRRTDGRMWEHRVSLQWQGYVDVRDDRVVQLAMLAGGDERLRWGNARFQLTTEADVEHLMAGHPIDLSCGVRYGLLAKPCPEDEVAEGGVHRGTRRDLQQRLQSKMRRLQNGIKQLHEKGTNAPEVAQMVKEFESLLHQQDFRAAEQVLDRCLKRVRLKIAENESSP